MKKILIGDFEFGIGVFRAGDWELRIGDGEKQIRVKHQSSIQNHQLVILSPIGDFHS